MKAHAPLGISVILALALAGTAAPGAEPGPEELLQEAFYREVALADPEGAIRGYKEVLSLSAVPPHLQAQAHLRLGICLRFLGEPLLAREQLQIVVEKHAREVEAVKLARRYLGQQAPGDCARLMPQDLLLYVELVDPSEHVRALSELVKGTPFQNPVDYYLSYLEGRSGPEPGSLPVQDSALRSVSAFLNEGFLRNLQKIEGLAVGLPGSRKGSDDFLAVMVPGSSDILRGLVQMAITLSSAQGAGILHESALFRIPPAPAEGELPADEWVHIALGNDLVILGRPRSLVEGAVERSKSGGPCLSDDPDFRRAQAARAGSLVFSYLSSRKFLEQVKSSATGLDLAAFERAKESLGFEKVHSLSFTLSHNEVSDALRVSFRARVEGEGLEIWKALKTPPAEADLLRAVPPGPLGFLATRWDQGSQRLSSILDFLKAVQEISPGVQSARDKAGLEQIEKLLASGPARAIVEEMDGLVIGLSSQTLPPTALSAFCVLRFKDGTRGADALEKTAALLLGAAFRRPSQGSFQDETLKVLGKDVPVRYLEPLPGFRLRRVELGDLHALSFSEAVLRELVTAHQTGRSAAREPLPPRSSKILFLRPSWLLKAQDPQSRIQPEMRAVLSEIDKVFISSREGKDSISLDLVIPGTTPAARAILQKLAELPGAAGKTAGQKE